MVDEMTKWERLRAAMKGQATDRVPVALWRHFPVDDQTPEGLAAKTVEFQNRYDWDLVKFTPTGTYGIEDWGAETVWKQNDMGVRTIVKHGVMAADQWPQLENYEVTQGYIGRQIVALGLAAQALKDEAPILQTVFSPLTTARKLAGDRIFSDLRTHAEEFKAGLAVITEVTTRFAQESLKAGAHGIFFATQQASYRLLSEAEYREFGLAYDLQILNAIRPSAEVLMLHMHGEDIMFHLTKEYPIDIVNWHDQITAPSLKEARQQFDGAVAGGVNEWHTLLYGKPKEIREEVAQSISQTGGCGYLVAPGCVIPGNTPDESIWAVRKAVM
jgi:uroporphyrinogen decarboxylase